MVQCKLCGAREAPGVPTMSLCGGCFAVSYCDAKCQKADRAAHRELCNERKLRREAHIAAPPMLDFDASGLNAAALRRAADAGNAAAMSKLASCYLVGTGGVGGGELPVPEETPRGGVNFVACKICGMVVTSVCALSPVKPS